MLTPPFPLPVAVGVFVAAAVVISVFGYRLTRTVDRLADRTGMGEAIAGSVLLASATSLAGLIVTVFAAVDDNPSLAMSNAVGGVAVQTAFIVVADLAYTRANLERAAASLTNVFNALLLITLLSIVVIGITTPQWTLLGVHPASLILFLAYGYGLWLAREVGDQPMWRPERTLETVADEPDDAPPGETMAGLWARFVLFGGVVAAAGWTVAHAGISIVETTPLSGTFVGAFVTSLVTSLPELVTAVAAVRTGALTLAVGGIVGGNTFDVLFVALGDIVYRDGSLYGQVERSDLFVVAWTMIMASILGAGLIRRERGRVGFEGIAIVGLYLGGLVTVYLMR